MVDLDEGEHLLAASITACGRNETTEDKAWNEWCCENGDSLIAELKDLRERVVMLTAIRDAALAIIHKNSTLAENEQITVLSELVRMIKSRDSALAEIVRLNDEGVFIAAPPRKVQSSCGSCGASEDELCAPDCDIDE